MGVPADSAARPQAKRLRPSAYFLVVPISGAEFTAVTMVRSRVALVAGLVVVFVIADFVILRRQQRPREIIHVQRSGTSVTRVLQQLRVVVAIVSVADQVMIEIRVPHSVKSYPALIRRLRHRAPAGMVLGNQKCRRIHHLHRSRQFAQKLDSVQIRPSNRLAIRVKRVVLVNRIGQVHTQPIDVKIIELAPPRCW